MVRGGDGSDTLSISDVVNTTPVLFSGTGATSVNLSGALLDAVTATGIEAVELRGASGSRLQIEGTAGNDRYEIDAANGRGTYSSTANPTLTFEQFEDFTLSGGTAGGMDQVLVQGTLGNDSVTVDIDSITLGTNSVTFADIDQLTLQMLAGDDVLTVDVDETALIGAALEYDGGSGADTLVITGTPTVAVDEVIYQVGPSVSGGRLTYEAGDDSRLMSLEFTNLEPVLDDVTAGTLTVRGTDGNNVLTYVNGTGTNGTETNGLVSVDGFETLEFTNKGILVLDGGAGQDTLELRHTSSPTGLTSIVVRGGDGSDTLSISDVVNTTPVVFSGTGATSVDLSGALLTDVTATGIEAVELRGASGSSTLQIEGTAGNDRYEIDAANGRGRAWR